MNQFFVEFFSRFVREEEGQDLVEYALLLGLISLVSVVAVAAVGTSVNGVWQSLLALFAGIPGA